MTKLLRKIYNRPLFAGRSDVRTFGRWTFGGWTFERSDVGRWTVDFVGCWMLDVGRRDVGTLGRWDVGTLDIGRWDVGSWTLDVGLDVDVARWTFGCWMLDLGSWTLDIRRGKSNV